MSAIATAAVAGGCGIVATLSAAWVSSRLRVMRADLDACLRDRRQLRQVLQLITGAFVGLLPERERLALLRTINETVNDPAA